MKCLARWFIVVLLMVVGSYALGQQTCTKGCKIIDWEIKEGFDPFTQKIAKTCYYYDPASCRNSDVNDFYAINPDATKECGNPGADIDIWSCGTICSSKCSPAIYPSEAMGTFDSKKCSKISYKSYTECKAKP